MVFSFEYFEIFRNTYFEKHLRMAAFEKFVSYINELQPPSHLTSWHTIQVFTEWNFQLGYDLKFI